MDCNHINPALFIVVAWAAVTLVGGVAKQRRRARQQQLEREVEQMQGGAAPASPQASQAQELGIPDEVRRYLEQLGIQVEPAPSRAAAPPSAPPRAPLPAPAPAPARVAAPATPRPAPRPAAPAPRPAPALDEEQQAWLDKGRRAERGDEMRADLADAKWDSDWDLRQAPPPSSPPPRPPPPRRAPRPVVAVAPVARGPARAAVPVTATRAALDKTDTALLPFAGRGASTAIAREAPGSGPTTPPQPMPHGKALAALCRDAIVWRDVLTRHRPG